ncbi:MAG: cation:proton antiporter [Anaerolineales bacterium]|nr:cation:proton antiporter [Anaerolineales bacterium]
MSTFLQFSFLLAIILIAAKAAGYLSTRLGQPSVLGELLIGILLGPSLINIMHLSFVEHELTEIIKELAELGVMLLMFIAGLELHLNELARNTRVAAYAGILGVVVPTALGWGTGRLFGMDDSASVFLGLTLGATSVSISAQTLMELKVLRSRVGLSLLGSAVFDDILVIFLLSTFLATLSGAGGLGGILLLAVRMIIFVLLSGAFGYWLLPGLVRRISRLPISQGILTLGIVIMLLYGLAAELVGSVAAITGSFFAGLMFARCREKERLEEGVKALAYGLFVPIFFINIGLSIDLRGMQLEIVWLTLAVILVAVIGKWLGSGLGAKAAGLSWRESIQLGAGMISRGEVGLIVASIGIQYGLVRDDEFSAIVAMILVTTIITPPILRALFSKPKGLNFAASEEKA